MPQTVNKKYPAPDFSLLNEMAEGDHDFFMEILGLFLDNAPGMVKSIKESAESGDFNALRFSSHKILSDLHVVGLNYTTDIVEQIERDAALGKLNIELIYKAIEMINFGIEDLKKIK
ncbi:MAG: Hpt domain-containing protein [Bacteroidales bacterium]|jgi:HPt (histidine-containing phosphotransfer) domain-containing protein|nr:Hpt domain-containing protein [Bacteroidales bacterium]